MKKGRDDGTSIPGGGGVVWGVIRTILVRLLALALLLLALPVMLVTAVIVFAADGWPVFFKSRRLGRDRKPFWMFKFRTLIRNADRVTGAGFHRPSQGLTIFMGGFLRDTRLDELPQLVNILLGHMGFVGPRPIRPDMYEKFCQELEGFDDRFAVRPGLIDYSQLFTPHCTAKRYRTLLDNAHMRQGSEARQDVAIFFYTTLAVLTKITSRAYLYFAREFVPSKLLQRFRQKRKLRRVTRPHVRVRFGASPNGSDPRRGQLVDINEEVLRLRCFDSLEKQDLSDFELVVRLKGSGGGSRLRVIRCRGQVLRALNGGLEHSYVVAYEPISPGSEYRLHQYVFRDSLAYPLRHRWPASVPPIEPVPQGFAGLPTRSSKPRPESLNVPVSVGEPTEGERVGD